MAAAAVSLACPLRRSTRLAHAHSVHRKHQLQQEPDSELDSSSDPENELTPRALRALKRQRLALDPDGFPLSIRTRSRKRRKENTSPAQRPSLQPLPLKRARPSKGAATPIPEPINDPDDNRPTFRLEQPSKPELSIPVPPISPSPSSSSSDSEPLTPLTPLTPSPSPSPSLPGHDRLLLPLSPPHEPLPPPVSIEHVPIPEPTDTFSQPSPSLDPALDTLIPFDALHPPFDPELSVQIPHPPTPPQLQGLELPSQFHSFQQPQLYVPPNPVFVRDREINIWKLACQERVDCLLRRYGSDYIKALVESQARSLLRAPSLGTSTQTKFRLYTPASYTYSLSTWSSTPESRKTFTVDDHSDDADPGWPMDDADWADADIDMEDEDEDDYEDEEEREAEREGETTLEAVDGLVITDTKTNTQSTAAMDVDGSSDERKTMRATPIVDARSPPRPAPEPSLRPSTPIPRPLSLPPSLTAPTLPPLSSLHVPLLSEPPRAFMGRGTPPDRRRLVEWSGSGRFSTNGIGPPLYISPVPPGPDVGIVSMSVDPPMHPESPQAPPSHTHGEWTSFLYSMLEGDGVGVGVGTSVGGAGHASEPTWYELGLASVPPIGPEPLLELSPTHTQTTTPAAAAEQPIEEGSNSSSTLRFALG